MAYILTCQDGASGKEKRKESESVFAQALGTEPGFPECLIGVPFYS